MIVASLTTAPLMLRSALTIRSVVLASAVRRPAAATRCFSATPGNSDEEVATTRMNNLLKVVACPVTKKPLRYDHAAKELVSDAAGLAFPIVNGIPNLCPSAGRLLSGSASSNANESAAKPAS
mmetsp:Transcript_71127/g.189857  ORF Transcript_71127/g.189857 Transcript_71127/m.189857 type:complete len:123 (+) Transcript_71127:1272-1640(+)